MFNLVINSNNVANSLNNSYEYKFKNGNFTIAEGSQIMITSLQIPYSWYNITQRYNNQTFKLYWPSPTVSSCTVTAGGSGYTSAPTVVFTGTPPPVNSVASITVTAGGSGYTSAPTVSFSGGGGTGATATAVISGAAVTSIIVTNVGSGYTSAPTVAFAGGAGTGTTATAVLGTNATATATISGSVSSITLSAAGAAYTSAPTVTFTGGGGSGAAATAAITNIVTSLAVTAGGTGYTRVPTVTFIGGGGSGATATAALNPTTIASYTVTSGGSGYTSAPTVAITGGGGTGATATVAFAAGAVTSVTVNVAGSGFTGTPTITFSGGGGTGAAAVANFTASPVSTLLLTTGGSGYTSAPTISFSTGFGSGAAGTATIYGIIQSINLTNGGSGYSSAPTIGFSGGGGSSATATAIITGSVSSISVTGGGTGYSASPAVSFSGGGGTGATAISSAYTPYTVTIPEGFYTVPALNIWLQQYCIEQKLYTTDGSGNNIYYLSFTQNTTYYANQIITKQIAVTGLTAPTGFPYPPTAFRSPYIEILNNDFTKLIGLKTGNYGRDLSGNLSQLSNITPQAATVNSLIIKCSLVNNGVTNSSDVVDAFAIANGKFGENLNYINNIEKWVNLSPGNYSNFIVTIVDQNLQDINIIDPNLLINFLVK